MTNSISDLHEADVIFIIGSNTTEAHPVLSLEVIKALREGKTLIVADPRLIDVARRAHLHLRLKPGSNVALLNGMMRHIVDMGWEDKEFISERTENYEALRATLDAMTVEQAAEICGVPADDIRKAAELFATAGAANILYAMGITQHHTGTNNVLSVANLAMLTGQIGRPGTGVNPLRGQSNVQGACDMARRLLRISESGQPRRHRQDGGGLGRHAGGQGEGQDPDGDHAGHRRRPDPGALRDG
jgi:formate dehydrogenase alpha subunit